MGADHFDRPGAGAGAVHLAALFDAAYDLPPRTLKKNWLPLISLAGIAVALTAAAVAWVGVAVAGLPIAAAIALGAIVAPPDAAAATAMLSRFNLPRRAFTVLKGKPAQRRRGPVDFRGRRRCSPRAGSLPWKLSAAGACCPGGILLGILLGYIYMRIGPRLAGTLGGSLFEFVATFGVWVIAEHLHLSAVLTIVAYAMVIAADAERRYEAQRLHSYSIWKRRSSCSTVLAFLLMGMPARTTVLQLYADDLRFAILFAGLVFLTVVGVRIAWLLFSNRLLDLSRRREKIFRDAADAFR